MNNIYIDSMRKLHCNGIIPEGFSYGVQDVFYDERFIYVRKNAKFYLLNHFGDIIIGSQFECQDIKEPYEGEDIVVFKSTVATYRPNRNGELGPESVYSYGAIDTKTGRLIVNPFERKYAFLWGFRNGFSTFIHTYDKNNMAGFIDDRGNEIISHLKCAHMLTPFMSDDDDDEIVGYFFTKHSKIGFLTKSREIKFFSREYDFPDDVTKFVLHYYKGFMIMYYQGYYGIMDINENWILEPKKHKTRIDLKQFVDEYNNSIKKGKTLKK
ncbi:MAG: hypothetical protein IJ574_00500 [Bacilli bacterium]|nr:hypothetical protein [Bacilli bacterium]